MDTDSLLTSTCLHLQTEYLQLLPAQKGPSCPASSPDLSACAECCEAYTVAAQHGMAALHSCADVSAFVRSLSA